MDNERYFRMTVIGVVEEINYESGEINFNNDGELLNIVMLKSDIANFNIKQEIKVHIVINEFNVIFGYLSKAVRDFLAQFDCVNGVSTRAAGRIYDYCVSKGMSMKDLCFEVSAGNYDLFTNAPGIGMKSSRRIVEALKDTIVYQEDVDMSCENEQVLSAVETLKSLGFNQTNIKEVIKGIDVVDGMSSMDIVQKAIIILQKM